MADVRFVVPLAGSRDPSSFASIVWDGLVIPPDSVLYGDGGQVTNTLASSTVLQDSSKTWIEDEWVGWRVRNTSDGSETVFESPATDSSVNSVTCTLSGGNDNQFEEYDYYEIVLDIGTNDEINYEQISNLGGIVAMTAKGVPSITGISGAHSFDVYITDISIPANSSVYTVEVTV